MEASIEDPRIVDDDDNDEDDELQEDNNQQEQLEQIESQITTSITTTTQQQAISHSSDFNLFFQLQSLITLYFNHSSYSWFTNVVDHSTCRSQRARAHNKQSSVAGVAVVVVLAQGTRCTRLRRTLCV